MDIVEATIKVSWAAQTFNFNAETFSFSNVGQSPKIGDVKIHKSFGNSTKLSSKWQKKEVNRWLCFLLRYFLDHPYDDVLAELILNNFEEKIYESMAKYLQSRDAYHCQLFTKSILRQNVKRGQTRLVHWVIVNLKKCKETWITKLVTESELKLGFNSSYMTFIEKFSSELRNDEEEEKPMK